MGSTSASRSTTRWKGCERWLTRLGGHVDDAVPYPCDCVVVNTGETCERCSDRCRILVYEGRFVGLNREDTHLLTSIHALVR